jgi:hypothetical protein
VKVLCGEGVANHTAPESCAATREGRSEALTGDSVGQPLSGENQLRSADAFRPAEGNTALSRELNLAPRNLEVLVRAQAAVAARHARSASSRRTRSVRREVRWRWTLNVLWTAA